MATGTEDKIIAIVNHLNGEMKRHGVKGPNGHPCRLDAGIVREALAAAGIQSLEIPDNCERPATVEIYALESMDKALVLNGDIVTTYNPSFYDPDIEAIGNNLARALGVPLQTVFIPTPAKVDWTWSELLAKQEDAKIVHSRKDTEKAVLDRLMQGEILIIVPKDGANTHGIDVGSGIVARLRGEGYVDIYYEGNRFGAQNLNLYHDRVYHAWGRMVEKYPTVARSALQINDLLADFYVAGSTGFAKIGREFAAERRFAIDWDPAMVGEVNRWTDKP